MKRILSLIALLLFASTASAQVNNISTRFVQATPVMDTSAYAAGDTAGSLLTFTSACELRTKKGELLGVKVYDKAATAGDVDLVLFSTSTLTGTFTDNAAFDPSDADLAYIVAYVPMTVHKAFNDNGITYGADIVRPVKCDSTGKLYGYLVARAARTQASSSDITVQIEVVAD